MSIQHRFKLIAIATATSVQLLLLLTFTWIAIPGWEQRLTNLQIGLWFLDVALALYLLYKLAQVIWRSTSRRAADLLAAIVFLGGSFAIMAGILYILYFVILLQNFTGFFCTPRFAEPIHFPQYGKTIYFKTFACRDNPANGGAVYVHESKLPLMKPLLQINTGFFGNSSLQQDGDILKISGQAVDADDPDFSTTVFYNLRTGEMKKVTAETR
ncbi:MAG: hypothetical protein ACFBSF_21095 [Leptolyngbyaceae cyanobacterium]